MTRSQASPARGMPIFGLVLPIALMALAANPRRRSARALSPARLCGVAVVAYVGLGMIWRGLNEVMKAAAGW